MLRGFISRYSSADTGGGSGGAGDKDDDKREQQQRDRPSDLLDRFGREPLRLAEKLAEAQEDNYRLREKNRQYKADLAAAQGKAAPEGAVILNGDDAKAWEAYQALKLKPDAIAAALTERDEAKQKLTGLERDAAIRSAAEAHGYKAGPLGKLRSLEGKALEVREVKDGEQTVKRAFVKDGTTETPLPDFLGQHEADFLPALTAESGGRQQASGGTSFVRQSAGGTAPKTTAGQQHVSKTKYAVPSKDK